MPHTTSETRPEGIDELYGGCCRQLSAVHTPMQRVAAQGGQGARPQEERGQRERAAFALAAAYADTSTTSPSAAGLLSSPPARTTASSSSSRRGNASWRPRPGSAKSYSSSRSAPRRGGAAGRISSARSGSDWGGGADDNKLRLEFRLRREAAARGRRGVTARGGRETSSAGGDGMLRVVDLEELVDENHRLKLALNRATEELSLIHI